MGCGCKKKKTTTTTFPENTQQTPVQPKPEPSLINVETSEVKGSN